MGRKKSAAKTAGKTEDKAPAELPDLEKHLVASPVSTTGAVPVYRLDMGESLPVPAEKESSTKPSRKAKE